MVTISRQKLALCDISASTYFTGTTFCRVSHDDPLAPPYCFHWCFFLFLFFLLLRGNYRTNRHIQNRIGQRAVTKQTNIQTNRDETNQGSGGEFAGRSGVELREGRGVKLREGGGGIEGSFTGAFDCLDNY